MGVETLELNQAVRPLFVYGTLRYADLLQSLLGRVPERVPAHLPGYAAHFLDGEFFPGIFRQGDTVTQGDLLLGLSAEEQAILDSYEAEPIYQFSPFEVEVQTASGDVTALAYKPKGAAVPGDPWALERWIGMHGRATVIAAREYMQGVDPGVVGARGNFNLMIGRGHSRVRAETDHAPLGVRRGRGGAEILGDAYPYSRFFAVREETLRFARFDGQPSAPVHRAALISGDAVTVLPYDPVRDRVLVIEQFRFGPHVRGDRAPWVLEPVAGRIDPGEMPEDTARRELIEEAGITTSKLLPVGSYYPSPGMLAEYLYSFVAICDLADDLSGRTGGLDAEDEDILNHLMSFDEAMALVTTGEADCAPLLISLMWLAGQRDRLRGVA